ncbi:hypothetical protein TanjilG_08550 [Lupinus angustifolius]|uniref:Uncharacterized protein n=1 Tax=Lupinus angustifolius TaxID=3871 RepID=A0A1J7IHA2_LUPAN|nr:hypothetical protein TanjilG_08550 [Lupinus angustifolius]
MYSSSAPPVLHNEPENENPNNSTKVMNLRSKLNVFGDLWNFKIPSRKRSKVVYKEKFQKELIDLLKNEMRPNESFHEEVLMFNNVNSFVSNNEIGLGAILLKPDDAST